MQNIDTPKILAEVKNYVRNEESYRFEIWIGLLSVALILGVVGNVFAMTSITMAKFKEKYHFHKFWQSTTIYFFNLLAVDLFYCLFLMAKIIHATSIFLKIHEDEKYETECRFFVLGTQTLGNIGGWSVMSIVFTQAIPKIR